MIFKAIRFFSDAHIIQKSQEIGWTPGENEAVENLNLRDTYDTNWFEKSWLDENSFEEIFL